MVIQTIATPAGWVAAAWSDRGLFALSWPQDDGQAAQAGLQEKLRRWGGGNGGFSPAAEGNGQPFAPVLEKALADYFRGEPVSFDIPVDLSWCTPFQKEILIAIRRIPYGEVRSYREVAAMAGHPRAARAAGTAAGANRTPVVIPCHRVIRKNGELGGFGGGLPLKKFLLALENGKSPR
jgi:methylated-DNA-[protein]-cysteine S-methyltransferase